jgi:glycerophosphoryl diester phosphodiesterase
VSVRAARTWAIAHRGASRDRPENTLAAFDEALRQGADAIELDLQLSRDGVPVVYHDRTLARAGGGRRRVARLALAELRRLDAGRRSDRFRGQRIPTLAEVLRRYARRTRLLLEVKTREGAAGAERHLELMRAVGEQVRRAKAQRRVLVLCFDTRVLELAARIAPGLRRVLNVRPPPVLSRGLRRRLGSLWALSADVRTLTPAYAAAVRRAGCRLLVFTCNTPAAVDRAVEAGAFGVMSDRPGWLAGRLRESRSGR